MAYSLALGAISFLLAVVWGSPLIRLLKQQEIGKQIRIEGPSSHQMKTGTPTMGGLMILIPVFLITAILNVANLVGRTFIGRSILVPMAALVAFGVLGAVDDLSGLRKERQGNGLLARYKLLWQVLSALLTALALYFRPGSAQRGRAEHHAEDRHGNSVRAGGGVRHRRRRRTR